MWHVHIPSIEFSITHCSRNICIHHWYTTIQAISKLFLIWFESIPLNFIHLFIINLHRTFLPLFKLNFTKSKFRFITTMECDASSSSSSHGDRYLQLSNSRGYRTQEATDYADHDQDEDQDQDKDKDILLLIYKYMRTKPGFSETLSVFQKELVSVNR